MPRGAASIIYLSKSDVECMNLFACCGNVSEEQALTSGISKHRIYTYLRLNKIERVHHHEGTFYRLTTEGRQFAKDLTGHEYVYHSNAFLHDSKGLVPLFISLSESEKST